MLKRTRLFAEDHKDELKPGLPFGEKRRLLPDHIEFLCYSFLDLESQSALFWSSTATAKQVVRYLRQASFVDFGSHLEKDTHFALLAAKQMRSLRSITSSFSTALQFKDTDPLPVGVNALLAVLATNRSTLKTFTLTHNHVRYSFAEYSDAIILLWSKVYEILVQCPSLESLFVHRGLPAGLLASINALNLPKLRSLTLSAEPANMGLSHYYLSNPTDLINLLKPGAVLLHMSCDRVKMQ